MKKLTYFIFTAVILAITSIACSGDSYEKRLKKETKAINNFLDDNNIEVIYEYPSNHFFKENQYYLEGSTGVYLQVIDPGKVEGALKEGDIQNVTVRFDSVKMLVSGTKMAGNNTVLGAPMKFTFGDNTTYMESYDTESVNYVFMSPACVLPLNKGVGSGAQVRMIVPFLNGSTAQKSAYQPFYFSKLIYTYNRHVSPGEDETEE